MKKIGFIGLGNMGAPMAANLAKAGYEIVGFDVSDVAPEGVVRVQTAVEAVKGVEAIVTMLPNGAIVTKVVAEILDAAAPGALLIDCSTIDVASAQKMHADAAAAGLRPLDAPVSGGVGGAAGGTLTFMVGGAEDALVAAKPLFDVMGARAVHCGAAAAGQMAKICNNMILGVSMIGVCEAFVLADKLGLDRQAMFDVASTSSGSCWSLNTYCPAPGVGPQTPADNDYKPGFAAELMLKDLKLAQDAASSAGAATPMGAAAERLFQSFVDARGMGHDFSAMILALAEWSRDDALAKLNG